MHATRFVLISRFRLHTNAESVWRLLIDMERWPQWWHCVKRVEPVPGWRAVAATSSAAHFPQAANIDWRRAFVVGFGVRVTNTCLQAPHLLESLIEGDVKGSGLWLIEPAISGNAVDVTHRLETDLHGPWPRCPAWLWRLVFTRIHFRVMHEGACDMARQLGCGLSEVSDWTGGPR